MVPLSVGTMVFLCVLGGIAMADDDTSREGSVPPVATPVRTDESAPPAFGAPQFKPTVKHDKLDGALAAIADTTAASGEAVALAAAEDSGLAVSGGNVRVIVESASPDLSAARAAILAAGGTVEGEYADTIQALIPLSGLDALAASPDVRYVRAPAGRATGASGRAP
jgi:hypothetical protein